MLVLVMLAMTLLFPLFLFIFGNPDRGPIITGYLGVFLQAAAFLSVGLWASSLTQNQIVAAIVFVCATLVLWRVTTWDNSWAGLSVRSSAHQCHQPFQSFPQGVNRE